MKKVLLSLFLFSLTILFAQLSVAQTGVKGVIKDSQTKETLVGANVVVKGTTNGTSTDAVGRFKIDVAAGNHTIQISYTGYDPMEMEVAVVNGSYTEAGSISLEASAIGLAGVSIIADRARERETPVAFSNLNKLQIQEQLGSRDIPLAMDITPNVYSTMQGGGSGDGRMNVRGFDQRNVAIMINGVPINDMENGWVYWSNWDGIGDATSSIQMQRGLSAVNLATPSIGGTMNVITNPAEQKGGIMYKQEFGTGNLIKSTIMGHSGLIDGKWAVSAGGVRKTGEGVIDKTWTDAWAYYFGSSYNINSKNRLELYFMGAPQKHGQNSYKQNAAAYSHDFARTKLDYPEEALTGEDAIPESYRGRYYNENWGSVNPSYEGQQSWNGNTYDRHNPHYINERENYYHKPLANLNWYSQLSDDVSLFTTAYYSGGKGGGSGTLGSVKWDYSGPSRMLDPNATIANNMTSDTARGILRNSVNNQNTYGLISKVRWNVSEKFKMSFGIDGRTAKIEHFRDVRDLLGGKFYMDNKDEFNPNRATKLGDVVDYFNTNTVNWLGGFAQGEYNYGNITAYGMAGYSMIKYGYTNHFKKDDNGGEIVSETDWIGGGQIKGGFSYRFTETLDAFVNAGYVSKVPIFDEVIDDFDGTKAADPKNEKFTSVEAGVTYKSINGKFGITGNIYYTLRRDRSFSILVQTDTVTNTDGIVFISGMAQDHMGLEIEGKYKPGKALEFLFAGSVNSWEYTKDVSGVLKEYQGNEPVKYNFYTNGLKVGDAPQMQGVLGIAIYPMKGLRAQLLGKYYANHYAAFDPFSRTDETDRAQVWETPAYTVFDLHASYDIPMKGDVGVQIFVHVFNLFDEIYIQDAVDNSPYNGFYGSEGQYSHTAASAEVYLGIPRTVNFGVILKM